MSDDELLTTSDVAAILNVHPRTVRNYAERGELPAMRLSDRFYRFDREDVEAFMDELRVNGAA